MSPPCIIKQSDSFEVRHDHFVLNGKRLDSLNNCKFIGNVHFSIPVREVVPPAVGSTDVGSDVGSTSTDVGSTAVGSTAVGSTAVGSKPTTDIKVPEELAEMKEMLDLARDVMSLPPWLAVAIIAAVVFQRWQKNKMSQPCAGHAQLSGQLGELSAKVQKLEQQDQALNSVMRLMQQPAPNNIDNTQREKNL